MEDEEVEVLSIARGERKTGAKVDASSVEAEVTLHVSVEKEAEADQGVQVGDVAIQKEVTEDVILVAEAL